MTVIRKEIGTDKFGRPYVQTKEIDYRSFSDKYIEQIKYFPNESKARAYFDSINVERESLARARHRKSREN